MKHNSMFMRVFLVVLIFGCGLFTSGCSEKPESADLVLTNGKIVTVEEDQPEVEALAVRGDIIIALGSTARIKQYICDATQVIDLEGRLAIPGIIDSHAHFSGIGEARLSLDLMKVNSWENIVAMVAEAAQKANPGEFITGRGWHQEKWDRVPEPNVSGLPYHTELSRVSPDNPVILRHASGHSSIANAKAMKLADITGDTPDPAGGEIVRDGQGNAIGVFRETAQGLLRGAYYEYRRTPEEMKAEQRKIVELAVEECLSKGITSLHDAGVSFEAVDYFKKMADDGVLRMRINLMISAGNAQLNQRIADYKILGYGGSRITVRSIKRLIDGALGAHGAWLLEPYDSLPSSTGLNTYPVEDLRETAAIAIENGFQLCVHAIGDRGNRETLDVYEETFKAHPDKTDLRWRIEHSQHLHPADIPRFGQMGVIAAMQGIHCTSDAPWVFKRLGEKRAEEGAYVWRKLIASGALICNGTDAPVEDVDPIPSFYASVSRKTKDGSIFFPDQRMTRMEALKSYTINAAYASFEENLKGSLKVGKLADITILDKDIMTID
ncbi:MAG: amidohydrolase, partial [Candidatus Aminicenantes bacterium]|nr:amidohydrolase [Candidatus Aminicenantes bacterium]